MREFPAAVLRQAGKTAEKPGHIKQINDREKGPDFPRNQVLFGGNCRTQTSALLGVKICRDVKELLLGGAGAFSQRHRFAVAIVACRQTNRCFQDRAFTVLPALAAGTYINQTDHTAIHKAMK